MWLSSSTHKMTHYLQNSIGKNHKSVTSRNSLMRYELKWSIQTECLVQLTTGYIVCPVLLSWFDHSVHVRAWYVLFNIGRPISKYQVSFNRLITPEDTRGEVLVSTYKYGSLAVSRLLGQPNTSILFFSIPPSLHLHSDRPTRQINSTRCHPVITECWRLFE